MSKCDEPPQRKNKIVDFARPGFAAVAGLASVALGLPNCRPAKPTVDATKKVRRSWAGDRRGFKNDTAGFSRRSASKWDRGRAIGFYSLSSSPGESMFECSRHSIKSLPWLRIVMIRGARNVAEDVPHMREEARACRQCRHRRRAYFYESF